MSYSKNFHDSYFSAKRSIQFIVFFALLSFVGAVLNAGCTTTTYNAFLSEEGMQRVRDVRYGPGNRHRLDVYRPTYTAPGTPVVIFVHGGAWNTGNKDMYFFAARSLVDQGYVAVLPNYRLFPTVSYPAFVEDTARAVAWTLENIHKYSGDPGKVFLMGHSAGAYNAAMVAYKDSLLEKFNVDNSKLRGFIGLAGLYDFLPVNHKHVHKVFGSEKLSVRTQPVNFVDSDDPEALLLHGKNDVIVDPKNSYKMNSALKRNGVESKLKSMNSLNHVYLILSVGPYFRTDYSSLDVIDKYIEEQLLIQNSST